MCMFLKSLIFLPKNKYIPYNQHQQHFVFCIPASKYERNQMGCHDDWVALCDVPMPGVAAIECRPTVQDIELKEVVLNKYPVSIENPVHQYTQQKEDGSVYLKKR